VAIEVLPVLDTDDEPKGFVFHCNTGGLVFGPVMDDRDKAEAFLTHCIQVYEQDPRTIAPRALKDLYVDFNLAESSVEGA